MIHVLDHTLEPAALLRDVFNALEPGGVLMVVTHNVRSSLARLLGRRWPPYTLQHPVLFSPRALRMLLASAGLEVLEILPTTNYFPLTFLLSAALTVVGVPARRIPEYQGPEIGLQLGNICTLARRGDQ
jgi:hypothetical protein